MTDIQPRAVAAPVEPPRAVLIHTVVNRTLATIALLLAIVLMGAALSVWADYRRARNAVEDIVDTPQPADPGYQEFCDGVGWEPDYC